MRRGGEVAVLLGVVALLGSSGAAHATERAAATASPSLLRIDNSGADSWLEVDRTLNSQVASEGTAGSDHDGSAVDMLDTLVNPDRSPR